MSSEVNKDKQPQVDASTTLGKTVGKLIEAGNKDLKDMSKEAPDLYSKLAKLDAGKALADLSNAKEKVGQYLNGVGEDVGVKAMGINAGEKNESANATKTAEAPAPVAPVAPSEVPMDRNTFIKENAGNLKDFYNYDKASGSIAMKFDAGSDADKFLRIGDIMKDIFKDMIALTTPKVLKKNGVQYNYINGTNGRFENNGRGLTIHAGDRISIVRNNEQVVHDSSIMQTMNDPKISAAFESKKKS